MVLVQTLPVHLLASFRTVADPLAGAASFQVWFVRETANTQPNPYRQERNIRDTNWGAACVGIQQPFTVGVIRVKADLPIVNGCRWS